MLKSLGLQSSEVEASIDYTDIISNSDEKVNIEDNMQTDNTSLKGENNMEDTKKYDKALNELHLNKLQDIATYEQELNVSSEERLVEMNYSTAHWQAKDNVTPDQVEALHNYITETVLTMKQSPSELRALEDDISQPVDKYYQNIKWKVFVSRFDFGNDNSINIDAIEGALNEVPAEYVLSQLSDEQKTLFADYYEASIDFAGNSEVNLSAADQQLYEAIIDMRKSSAEISKLQNEPSNKTLNKSYYQTLLNEESLWKVGESDTFSYKGENFVLKKENADNREVYSIYKDETAAPLYQYESMKTTLINFIADKDADKSIYSGEVTIYFDGDDVSITDKYDHQITLQPRDDYSYNDIEEYLNGIAEIHPEYAPYIEEHLDKLISDYDKAMLAASNEAKGVRLSQLEADMYAGGGYGEDSANSRTENEISKLQNESDYFGTKGYYSHPQYEIYGVNFYGGDMHFKINTGNWQLGGVFRVYDPESGTEMTLLGCDPDYNNYEQRSEIKEHWNSIEEQCRNASLEKYKELTGHDYSFSNEIMESKIEPLSEEIPHITLDEYLAQQGLSSPVDDFMIDKIKLPHGQSKYDERTTHENARKSSQEYHEKRNTAIKEYQAKIEAGEIIEPTNLERYMKTAMGNPEKASVQAARRVLEKRGYTQNDNGEWILSHSPNEQTENGNTEKIRTLLEQNNELPYDILSNKDLIKWYSFSSQINNFEATEKALQNILKNDMQIVSLESTENNKFRLVSLNENLRLQNFDDKEYSSGKEAMDAAYSNRHIVKIVSYQDMLNSVDNQSFQSISEADNLKYPHVQILNSDNDIIKQENQLSLKDADKLFTEQAEINNKNGISHNADIKLFLDRMNTYKVTVQLGNNGSGLVQHIKQYLNNAQNEISANQSLQILQEYMQENYPDSVGTENVLHQQMELADCFDFTS